MKQEREAARDTRCAKVAPNFEIGPAFHSEGLIPMLCHNPFKGFTLRSESFKGCRGPNNCFLKCPSASSSRGHTEAPSSCKGSRGPEEFISCTLRNPSFRWGPLKWLVLSTSIWNEPSIWLPWLFSLWSALRRAIYPIWNAPRLAKYREWPIIIK